MHIGEHANIRLTNAVARVIDKGGCDLDIDIEGRRIGQIAKARIIWHHGMNGAVVFKDCRFSHGDLFELQCDFVFVLYFLSQRSSGIARSTHESIRRGSGETRCRR